MGGIVYRRNTDRYTGTDMAFPHYGARTDSTHQDIVKGLRELGYVVEIEGRPVDLRVRHPTWIANTWVKLECKGKNRKNGFVPRKDQQEQTDYCHAHGIPYVFSAEDALQYLRIRGLKLMESI